MRERARQSGNGELEFLTKWEGYTNDHNTWEKIASILTDTALTLGKSGLKNIKNGLQ